jgi:NAD(P)-dependent dehydrogenase (short-subunit alcohol dehydrogenase family)
LAERGARVAVHYYRNKEAAQATLENIRKLGSDGFLVQADVCRPEEIRRMFQQVRAQFGSLAIFVSNARPEAAAFYEAPIEITTACRKFSRPVCGNGRNADGLRWVDSENRWISATQLPCFARKKRAGSPAN